MRSRVMTFVVLLVCVAGACGGDEKPRAQVVSTPAPAPCTLEDDDPWLKRRKEPGADVPAGMAGFVAVWRFGSSRPWELELSIVSVEREDEWAAASYRIGGWFSAFGYVDGRSLWYGCDYCIDDVDESTLRIEDDAHNRRFTFKITADLKSIEATREQDGDVKTFTLSRCLPPQ
jgi:hypothetical protein